jgi:hypothetical protein
VRVQRNFDTTSLDHAFLEGSLVLVSDGSYKEGVGSAAWILSSTRTYETFATGQCPTTGPSHAQDSHRSELFGILSGLVFLKKYLSKFDLVNKSYSVLVGLDNTSAMNYVFNTARYPVVRSYYPDFDVIKAARSLLNTHIAYQSIHIAGHQDKFVGPLDFLSTLNVQMDTACKRFRGVTTTNLSAAILPNQTFILTFQQNMVCKQVETTLREGISAQTMGLYWDRHDLSQFAVVSWKAIGKAMRKETPLKRQWIVKHSTGNCGVNKKLVEWKEKDSAACVRCGEIETAGHVWTCQHNSTRIIWDQSLIELKEWMINHAAAPDLTVALIQGLTNWYNGNTTTNGCHITKAQHTVGWQHIITGKFHILWIEVQQHHFLKIGCGKKSALGWLSKLISRIWKIAWTLWDKRNEYEHEDDQENKNRDYTLRIEHELAIGFDNIHDSCHYLFSEREITHLRTVARVEYKRNWLELVIASRFVLTSASIPIPALPIAPLPV